MDKRKINLLFYVILALTLVGGTYFALESREAQLAYSDSKLEYTNTLNWADRILDLNNWFFDESTWMPKKVVTDSQFAEMDALQSEVKRNAWIALIIAFSGIIVTWFMHSRLLSQSKHTALAILSVSLIALGFGVATPMMEIEAYAEDLKVDVNLEGLREPLNQGIMDAPDALGVFRDILGKETTQGYADYLVEMSNDYLRDREKTFEGRMYLYYQSKSILDLIGILFKQNNYVVAIAILMFSVVIPILKVLISLLLLVSQNIGTRIRIKKIIGYLGKWSMADVFVVSMYLAYLSFQNINIGFETGSQPLVGLYSFGLYVILSIFSYFLVEKHIKLNYHGKIHTPELVPESKN